MFDLPNKPLYRKTEDLSNTTYDLVVYGSDQIWRYFNNPSFKGFDLVYFGASLSKVQKKIAYAASMGVIINQPFGTTLNTLFNNFNSISVRENDLKQFVDEITGKKTTVVLDPVFLLDKNDWRILSKQSKFKYTEDYILLYNFFHSDIAIELTNMLQNKYRCEVIEISSRVEPFLIGKRYVQTCNTFDFVSLFENAKCVVTTSFHGLAFSLLFEKQFYSLGMQNNSGRAQTLINNLTINNRYITNINQINLNETINYQDINNKLIILKQNSLSYLKEAIKS